MDLMLPGISLHYCSLSSLRQFRIQPPPLWTRILAILSQFPSLQSRLSSISFVKRGFWYV